MGIASLSHAAMVWRTDRQGAAEHRGFNDIQPDLLRFSERDPEARVTDDLARMSER